MAFSPNCELLATGSSDGSIVLWEAATGKVLHTLKGHRDAACGLAFTPDNKTFVSTGYDGTTRVWEVASGKETAKFAPNTLKNSAVVLSAEGKIVIVAGAGDGIIRYFDIAAGKQVHQMEAHKLRYPGALTLALSANGKILASGGHDKTIRFWDAETAAELGQLPEQSNSVARVALSPDGSTIAWATYPSSRIHLGKFAGLPKGFQFKEFSPRGGHEMSIGFVTFSPDGKKILATSQDNTAILWEESTGKELQRFQGGPLAAWSHDGKLLALADSNDATRRAVLLFDVDTGKFVGLVSAPAAVVSIEFTPNRMSLLVACHNGAAYLLELATGQIRTHLPGKASPFWRAVLAPDGLTLAMAGQDVRICDTITGSELARLPLQVSFGPLVFSPDGKTLACRDFKAVVLWDLGKGKEIRRHNHLTYSLAFTPDGQTLVGACQDESIRLWDVATGKQLHEFRGHGGWIHSVAVSPDGRTLASGSIDATLLLWPMDPFVKGKPIPPSRLSAPEFQTRLAKLPAAKWEQCWKELAEQNAQKAYRAMWGLVAEPKKSAPALKKWADELCATSIERLVADLDSDDFAQREQATKTLERLGNVAEAALRAALAGKPSTESQRRIERLLAEREAALAASPEVMRVRARRATWATAKLPPEARRRVDWLMAQEEAAGAPGPDERLRLLRAIEVLEHIGTPEARTVLALLAKQSSVPDPGQHAKAALARLAKRP